MDKDSLRREAARQGEYYSGKVREEYDTFFSSAWWDFIRRETACWMLSQCARLLSADSQPWDLLDVGCGIGFTAFEMARRGGERVRRITGLDASAEALALAETRRATLDQRDAQRLQFLQGNFFDHQGGPYHAVYMNEVFEHLPSAQAVFEKAGELVRPGGLLLISTPNRDRLSNRVRALFGRAPVLLDPIHIMEYSLRELRAAPGGWTVQALTGRQIADEDAAGMLLSLGIGRLRALVAPAARTIACNRVSHALGAAAPAFSTDLFAAYRRETQ